MTNKFKQYALALKQQKLYETEELYQKRLDDFIPLFQENFRNICSTIIQLQTKQELGEISYLEYTFLFTNAIQGIDTAQVRTYGSDWYLDGRQLAVGNFDYSFLFTGYRELWAKLLSSRKRYPADVNAQEIRSFLLSCAGQFFKYVAALCRFSVIGCIESEPFLSIKRDSHFEINSGEYMAYTEAVYKENRTRTAESCLNWFALRHEYAYAFEDFSGLDFSGADLSEIDLRYADLRNANLTGTNLEDSMLNGSRFCHASLKGANFKYCQLHEADFTGANLTNACFTSAHAHRGVLWQAEWMVPGFRSVSFRNANLTNADFRKTDIKDADFTGAVMDGALFSEEQIGQFSLTAVQRAVVQY